MLRTCLVRRNPPAVLPRGHYIHPPHRRGGERSTAMDGNPHPRRKLGKKARNHRALQLNPNNKQFYRSRGLPLPSNEADVRPKTEPKRYRLVRVLGDDDSPVFPVVAGAEMTKSAGSKGTGRKGGGGKSNRGSKGRSRPANGPSKTGSKSGRGRGNNPPRGGK